VSGQLHAPAALLLGKEPNTHWIGGWVDPRASLHDMEKWKFFIVLGLKLRPLCCPAHRKSCGLHYSGSKKLLLKGLFATSWKTAVSFPVFYWVESRGSLPGGVKCKMPTLYFDYSGVPSTKVMMLFLLWCLGRVSILPFTLQCYLKEWHLSEFLSLSWVTTEENLVNA
jgi:hypothetical protein